MTTYRLYPSTDGPVNSSSDNSKYVMGVSFKVTSDSMQLDGWWWWVASDQDVASFAGEDFALWTVNGANSGTYVTGSKVTSGTFTAGQWNFVPCSAPIALTNGQEYRAAKTTNKGNSVGNGNYYSSTSAYFNTGDGANGIVNGPLVAFSKPANATNPEPSGDGQMVFTTTADDITNPSDYPSQEFGATNYWLDVQVSDISGAGNSGTGGITAQHSTLAGTGKEKFTGTGAFGAPAFATDYGSGDFSDGPYGGLYGFAAILDGSGTVSAPEGSNTGSITAKHAQLSGSGRQVIRGSGGITAKHAVLHGGIIFTTVASANGTLRVRAYTGTLNVN